MPSTKKLYEYVERIRADKWHINKLCEKHNEFCLDTKELDENNALLWKELRNYLCTNLRLPRNMYIEFNPGLGTRRTEVCCIYGAGFMHYGFGRHDDSCVFVACPRSEKDDCHILINIDVSLEGLHPLVTKENLDTYKKISKAKKRVTELAFSEDPDMRSMAKQLLELE